MKRKIIEWLISFCKKQVNKKSKREDEWKKAIEYGENLLKK